MEYYHDTLFIGVLPACYGARLYGHEHDFDGQNNIDLG